MIFVRDFKSRLRISNAIFGCDINWKRITGREIGRKPKGSTFRKTHFFWVCYKECRARNRKHFKRDFSNLIERRSLDRKQ
jgi:hypothetical protein